MKTFRLAPLLLAATTVLAASHVPKANTHAAIKAYVDAAAKIVQKDGPSCATFASPEWRSGQWYIFVDGPNDEVLCHPNASLVGKSSTSVMNAKGDKVGAMIAAKGKGNGSGWVEYLWTPPGKAAEELKTTYVVGVSGPGGKHYVVGAGGWNVK
ncbi:MAG TPA: cache domain-containing protein [Thermoanaerobaculia bacterium]|nr:cache domain-containing protein [Thermoanaerobaculia bacterium]